jgi:DNA-binding CsgD family transcriptional regulator/PAS domain-containing protein
MSHVTPSKRDLSELVSLAQDADTCRPDGPSPALAHLLDETARLHDAALDPVRWPDVVRAATHRLGQARESGLLSPGQIAWMKSIIDSAARICAEVARLELLRDTASLALDSLALGVIVLDGRGVILRANPAGARLFASLQDSSGTRSVHTPGWSPLPGALVPAANDLRDAHHGSLAAPHVIRLSRPGRPPLHVLAVPMQTANDGILFPDARMVWFLVDPGGDEGPSAADLSATFTLTPTESRVAAHLANGQTMSEVARTLGIRITTARTHLRHIFAKTDTTRQQDLIRVLLSVPRGVAAPD